MSETNAAATMAVEPAKPAEPREPTVVVPIGDAPHDSTELMKQAQLIAHGRGLIKDNATKEQKQQAYYDTAILIMAGAEVGMRPIQALQSLYVTEGRVGWMGPGALARLRSCGALGLNEKDWDPTFENLPPDGTELSKWPADAASVISFRRANWKQPRIARFTVEDAKRAGLWNKKSRAGYDTPWTNTPKRMLQWRNAGFIFKDFFSDALLNMPLKEEIQDIKLLESVNAAPPRAAHDPQAKPARVTFSAPIVADTVDAEMVETKAEPSANIETRPLKSEQELLDKIDAARDEPTAFDLASAEASLRAECSKRASGDVAAAGDLFKEVTSQGLASEQDYDNAMAAIRQHLHFGDDDGPPVLTSPKAEPKKGGRK